jgi:RNA polymerase sigma-70 factor (ECF subfamily)
MENRSTDKLYERLLDGDEAALVEVYDLYKQEFLNFFKKYDINEESVLDIYQDCNIVIYQRIYVERLELKSSSLKTYIFGIGKHKVYDYFKKRRIQNNNIKNLKVESKNFEIEDTPNIYEQSLAKNLSLISENCQHILKLFYYRGLSIKDIVKQTDYKDENTVKSHKSRCLKKLKELCKA